MTDWPALIARLERVGRMRHIDIAVAVGRSEGWVGRLKRGQFREPSYSVGVLLMHLDSAGRGAQNASEAPEKRA